LTHRSDTMKLLLLAGTLALCASLADAFSSMGFNATQREWVCSKLTPGHGGLDFQTDNKGGFTNGGFTLEEKFLPDGTINVTLSHPSAKLFKGFIIQVQGAEGTFENTPYYDVGCTTQGATIRHANSDLKSSVSAIWTSSTGGMPHKCIATVVENWTTFYKVA